MSHASYFTAAVLLLTSCIVFAADTLSKQQRANCGFTCSKTMGCHNDITDEDCKKLGKDFYLMQNVDICECCPGCKKGVEFDELCSKNEPCAPGLKCNILCFLDKEQCAYPQHLKPDEKKELTWMAKCLPDGRYAPVQCKGDKATYGRCFCTSAKGKRIFGWMWYKDADDMSCGCSRRRDELEEAGRADVTLHCSENGDFEELQCDQEVCWCADVKTGDPLPGIPIVPEAMLQRLPCYNVTAIGGQYQRQCESQKHAQEQMRALLRERGTMEATMLSVFCEYDGGYGPVQLDQGTAFCAGRDKIKLGNWIEESGQAVSSVNCNCARDHQLYKEHGLQMSLKCEQNGNYAIDQEHDAKYFCVDRDGFAITALMKKKPNCGELVDLYP